METTWGKIFLHPCFRQFSYVLYPYLFFFRNIFIIAFTLAFLSNDFLYFFQKWFFLRWDSRVYLEITWSKIFLTPCLPYTPLVESHWYVVDESVSFVLKTFDWCAFDQHSFVVTLVFKFEALVNFPIVRAFFFNFQFCGNTCLSNSCWRTLSPTLNFIRTLVSISL